MGLKRQLRICWLMQSDGAPRICFVGLKCLDHLTGEQSPRYIGGIERQLSTMARALRDFGCNVSFVTFRDTSAAEPFVTADGIRILPSYAPDQGVVGLRTVYPRLFLLWKAVSDADSAYCVQMGSGLETLLTAIASRLAAGRPEFVFFTASDVDCRREGLAKKHWADRLAYRLALRLANRVVVQTQSQKLSLEEEFGIKSSVATLPYRPPVLVRPGGHHRQKPTLLWVGRIVPIKRPEWLLELADGLPDWELVVVGSPNRASDYARNFETAAADRPNLSIRGRLPERTLHELYAESDVLCCTSALEGFPTTFLESWYYGLPIVTSFDPDGVVERNDLGQVCVDVETMIDLLRSWPGPQFEKWRGNARAFFKENYGEEALITSLLTSAFKDSA